MPTISLTSLDRLIEPASSSASKEAASSTDRSTTFSFYPPLYATPPQQRPPSPTSFSPSPYVLNFKRRGPVQQQQKGGKVSTGEASAGLTLQQQQQGVDASRGEDTAPVPVEHNRLVKPAQISANADGVSKKYHEMLVENDVFEMELDKRDALNAVCAYKNKGSVKKDVHCNKSFSSNIDPVTGRDSPPTVASFASALAINEEPEFFDAPDSVFCDSASEDEAGPSSIKPGRCLGGCGGRTVPILEEEIARRIKAEETVVLWQMRWNEMARRCSSIGLSISSQAGELLENNGNTQELLVARLVGGAIASAVVRAEKEEELEHMLGVKNREISRLWDKLQYLELVNREMSQRNQEVTELSQRRRKRRQRRRKLALGCFCATFCIGTAGLVLYKFVPWDQAKGWANFHISLAGEPSSDEVCRD